MGFRMRKSLKVSSGVRLNVSKRGVGMSVGAGGVRYSAHSSGRRTVSARSGVPGVWYQKQTGSPRSSSKSSSRAYAPAPPVPPSPQKPGLFAPKAEKMLFKAWNARDANLCAQAGEQYPDAQVAAFTLAGLMLAGVDGDRALSLLERAFASGQDPAGGPFFRKYVHGAIELKIAEGITAHVPLGRDAAGLTLAELYQSEERLGEAIETVEHLEPTAYAAVSLAELYLQAKRYDEVVQLTEGIANEDDATALLIVFRGVAFRDQGFHDAAHEAFKEALRSRSRDAAIRHLALSERATNYIAQGKKGMARKDLERILAEDSGFEGVRERLADLRE
jgi:tetratricopeptide (TPR) repeat protein